MRSLLSSNKHMSLFAADEGAPQENLSPKTPTNVAIQRAVKGKSWLKVRALGVGAAAGQEDMPNEVFETLVDTNDAW
ncbi:hypothetical protein EON64_12315, partial [archaeon]